MHRPMPRSDARARGVTLIEVMVTTAIIGVLAALAIVGYSRWTRSARMSEATNMLASIKTAQENYFSQTNRYFDVSKSLQPPDLFPAGTPGATKTAWTATCTMCTVPEAWERLGVRATEPVWFGYATVAGDEVTPPSAKGTSFTIGTTPLNWASLAPGGIVNKPWFITSAMADSNGNGKFAKVVSASFATQVLTDNAGE